MIDKVIFNVKIDSEEEALFLAERNNLDTYKTDDSLYYESKKDHHLSGIYIKIRNRKVQIKCSLHKIYYKAVFGVLDNSKEFTMSNALESLNILFDKIGIGKERAKVTYYEIGLNIPTNYDPLLYIESIRSIVIIRGRGNGKDMFIDANFKINRQKTTIKTRTTKKVFKIYDKGHENADRKRTAPTGEQILRIETMFRRQSIEVLKLFSKDNLKKIEKVFRIDWANAEFERTIRADKGVRESEKAKAVQILLLGAKGYLEKAQRDLERGDLTDKSFRTIREFVRDWEDNRHKYRLEPSYLETEYRAKLLQLLKYKHC